MAYINYDNKLMTYYDRLLDLVYSDKNLVADAEMNKRIDFVLDTLYEREKQVLELHYKIGLTLDEIGAKLQVTKERVRQIECNAIRKLRQSSRLETIITPDTCIELQERIKKLENLQIERHKIQSNLEQRLLELESINIKDM